VRKKNESFRVSDDYVELITAERKGYCDPEELDTFLEYGSDEIGLELERLSAEIKRDNR
jgi:hypothetical protein